MKSSLTPIALILLAGIAFFYYIQPGYAEIQKLRAQSEQYDIALEKAREFEDIRNQLTLQLNQFQSSDLERLKRMIPDSIDSTRLIIEINEIAKRYSSGIESIRISDLRQTGAQAEQAALDPYNTITIGFSMKSSYENFLQFLEDVEENLRLTDVQIMGFLLQQKVGRSTHMM